MFRIDLARRAALPVRWSARAAALAMLCATAASAAETAEAAARPVSLAIPPDGVPAASVDLRSAEGVRLLRASWRYSDARVDDIDYRSVGPDRKPSGPANRTHAISPDAGGRDFDDSRWAVLDPTSLEERRSTGKVCFNWYRLRVTIPETVAGQPTEGMTAVLQATVDDYAEIWVDGQLPRELGQAGGTVVAGFNVPNRVVIAEDVTSGQEIQLAIFGMNGPISAAPENYIWIREARVDFYLPPTPAVLLGGIDTGARALRRDSGLDRVLPPGFVVEKLSDGFTFGEGPVWSDAGHLLFSDPNTNVIYKYLPRDGTGEGTTEVFRRDSGYAGADIGRYRQPGSNGLAFDREGRLTVCQHGNRRVIRIEADGRETILADRYDGARLNSPNDLVYKSDGSLYFTDPHFGLPGFAGDPAKEIPFSGVYRWKDGAVTLLTQELDGPNGIAFSPDERYLYIANWDVEKKWLMRYPVRGDGTLGSGTVFFDMTGAPGEEALDGVKVDQKGNLFVSGPGGVWILSPEGKHLGTLVTEQLPANFAWGDADGRTLYMTARSALYRVRLQNAGAGRVTLDHASR